MSELTGDFSPLDVCKNEVQLLARVPPEKLILKKETTQSLKVQVFLSIHFLELKNGRPWTESFFTAAAFTVSPLSETFGGE